MEEKNFIYLDNNATTLLDPLVKEFLYKQDLPLNPSSFHSLGRKAFSLLSEARYAISHFLGVHKKEIFFTSGATEGLNFLIRGFASSYPKRPLISSTIEHPAVLETLLDLQKKGSPLFLTSPTEEGRVDIASIKDRIQGESILVFSCANTETGVKNPLKELSDLALQTGSFLIVDGVGLLGKEPFEIEKGISAMAFSAHKFHGPLGVGFVYLSEKCPISPLITGGGQEKGIRSGTENLFSILGMAKALSIIEPNLASSAKKMESLRDHFEKRLLGEATGVFINGTAPRLVNTSNLFFEGVLGEDLLILLDQNKVFASYGSACSSQALEPSRVLLEMNLSRERALSSIRFSLSRFTTLQEINKACDIIILILSSLRAPVKL